MVFFGWGLLLRRASARSVALAALATSFLVELSQLYQAEWIQQVRSFWLARMVLGTSFHAPDLIAYTVGVAIGVVAERGLLRR